MNEQVQRRLSKAEDEISDRPLDPINEDVFRYMQNCSLRLRPSYEL